jgi:hypothetical protein
VNGIDPRLGYLAVVRAWLVLFLVSAACVDKAKADYDRCIDRQKAYDVPGAYSACAAAVAADPRSVSGQAAAKELDNMKPVVDKLEAERAEKHARDTAITKDEPPPPPPRVVASVAPAATLTVDAAAPVFAQAQMLATNGDAAGARALLEPRVFGATKGSPDEVALLKGICKQQKDKACLTALQKKYR